jgi:site-specific recombinase XerD
VLDRNASDGDEAGCQRRLAEVAERLVEDADQHRQSAYFGCRLADHSTADAWTSAAGRIVRRIARQAGIVKRVGPHTLRHAFITAALDAGVPLRGVQEAASHADPRTTMHYDRGRQSLDRHATYIVATFVAGASR